MESWDVRSLDIEAHHPQVLRSDDETRAIAIHLPAGEQLAEHQVHERSYLVVVDGEISISPRGGKCVGRRRSARALRAERAAHDQRRDRRAADSRAGTLAGQGTPVTGGVSRARVG